MKTGNMLKVATTILCVAAAGIWFVSSTDAAKTIYEVRPEVRIGTYPNDSMHVTDAYERLMDRYMTMVQNNLTDMKIDLRGNARKLDSIDKKMDDLAVRISRIEKALNISPAKRSRPAAKVK